ncbi:PREDICTED: uncharacterized protein LOC106817753 [Priapulus caudatus]|uniref:Uncharacterized protein LOC106817753 n=1 Tax=Priapulus caudatus TaxID=37621 RepID=A0ABM1F0G2_PRICU|nr:PREDICTED: uncharacterized protein LOC106817753 [Priapulus caudatus]
MMDNLHDYSTGFLAQKNFHAGVCYIGRLNAIVDSTYENARADVAAMTEGMTAPMPEYIDMGYDSRPIGPLVLKDVAGDDVAEFCKDMPSYWLFPLPEDQRPEAIGVRTKREVNCNVANSCNRHGRKAAAPVYSNGTRSGRNARTQELELSQYPTGFLAQKNRFADICYIKRLDPILDSTYENARADVAAMTEGMTAPMPEYIDMGYDSRPIGPLVLKDVAGDDIAEFCKDMPSYWLFPVPEDQRPEATGVRTKRNPKDVTINCNKANACNRHGSRAYFGFY